MDRMIYTALSGAKQILDQQAAVSNNLANASTTAFKAQVNMYRAVPVVGQETQTRAFTLASTPGADMKAGPLSYTGRNLDVALQGNGWLAVQMPDGSEAYTRAGSLQVSPTASCRPRWACRSWATAVRSGSARFHGVDRHRRHRDRAWPGRGRERPGPGRQAARRHAAARRAGAR
jgi:hypothetical protein